VVSGLSVTSAMMGCSIQETLASAAYHEGSLVLLTPRAGGRLSPWLMKWYELPIAKHLLIKFVEFKPRIDREKTCSTTYPHVTVPRCDLIIHACFGRTAFIWLMA
jgi:hypothetical protein